MKRFTLTLTLKVNPNTILSPSSNRQILHDLPDDTEVLNEVLARLQKVSLETGRDGLSHNPSFSITPVGVSLTPDQGYQ